MNKLFKIICAMFIFAFLVNGVFADSETIGVDIVPVVEISAITSDAIKEGVLGIGETITFTVRLNRPMENAKIHPDNYNEGKLVWSTKGDILFTATYTVEEGHPDLKEPLQLEDVFVFNETDMTDKVSGTDVEKIIDASSPILKNIIINKINKNNYDNYTIEADLIYPEDYVFIKYRLLDNQSKEIKGEMKLKDALETTTHVVINNLNLSSLADGDIKIELEIIDAGLNKFIFEQKTIKSIIVPEILKTNLININKYTENNYSFDMIITGNLKNAKVVGVLKDTVGNSLPFIQVISELSSTEEYTFSDVDVSILKDGIVNLEIYVVDSADNTSKIIEEIIYKDVVVPEITLDKDSVYSNSLEFTLQGTVIDRLNERIKVTYKQEGFEEKECVIKYSPSDTNGYNFVTCNVELKEEGETKLIITTKDSSDNFSEDVVYVNVNTSEVSLFFDNGLRVVTNDSSSILKITGTYKLSDSPDANSKYFAALKKSGINGFNKYDLNLNEDNIFSVDLNNPILETFPVSSLPDGEYLVVVYVFDVFGNKVTATQKIIIDSAAPKIEINNLETTNRNPELSGKVIDDLNTTVEVVINDVTYNAIVDGQNWSVQITETLPLGSQSVRVIAKDEALNETEETKENALTINSTGGGGTRIYPATHAPVVPETTPEEPEETTPVEPQPEENPNIDGEVITPQEEIEPVEETSELVETPVETPTPSGLTGFAGFASSPGGVVTIVGSVLLVIGAVGYFFLLRPR